MIPTPFIVLTYEILVKVDLEGGIYSLLCAVLATCKHLGKAIIEYCIGDCSAHNDIYKLP